MKKRFKLIFFLLSASITLSIMSHTYSRYVAESIADVQLSVSKWQILINENDITNNNVSSIEVVPFIYESQHVKNNTIAPASSGYFDLYIDPSSVEMSFDYTLTLDVLNENIPDLLINNYSIISTSDDTETPVNDDNIEQNDEGEQNNQTDIIDNTENNTISNTDNKEEIINNTITGTFIYSNEENFSHKPFTIRIFFEWREGENELMGDSEDSAIATDALLNETLLKLQANIQFKQIVN